MIFRKFEFFLAQKLFITFSERGMISIPLDTSGTKAQGRVNALRLIIETGPSQFECATPSHWRCGATMVGLVVACVISSSDRSTSHRNDSVLLRHHSAMPCGAHPAATRSSNPNAWTKT